VLLGERAGELACADPPRLDENHTEEPAGAPLLGDCHLEPDLRQDAALDEQLAEGPPGKASGIHTPGYRQLPPRT
jgi:hypothetical protein